MTVPDGRPYAAPWAIAGLARGTAALAVQPIPGQSLEARQPIPGQSLEARQPITGQAGVGIATYTNKRIEIVKQ